jgi:hypothetical protein
MKKSYLFILVLQLAWLISPAQDQLVDVPEVTNNYTERTQIAYAQSDDAMANMTYAYVAFVEKDLNSGEWKIIIRGHKTAGSTFNPFHSAFKRKCNEAAKKGEAYFVHGFSMKARSADSRNIEHRVYVDKAGNPTFLELYLVTRNPDGSPKEPVSTKVEWPKG